MDIQKSLETRKKLKARKPTFVKQDVHKKPKLSSSYRKPRGLQSKMRLEKRGYRKTPSQGYRSPVAVRNMSVSGKMPFVVSNVSELEKINTESESIIIGSSVGTKNKVEIVKAAVEKKIFIENVKDAKAFLEEVESSRKNSKASKEKKLSERASKKEKQTKEAKEKEKKESVEEKVSEEDKKKTEKEEKDKILQKKQ
jgi:large subunit ribosomal protein L32e